MRWSGTVSIPAATLSRLAAAARSHDQSLAVFASTAVKAAARLWLNDVGSTAMPLRPRFDHAATSEVKVTVADGALAVIASAAHAHSLSIEAQIRAVLEAAVETFDPVEPEPECGRPAGRGIPARRPFDPRDYAKGPLPAPATTADLTGALMGDPGHGPSVSARSSGRTWDGV